MKFYWLILGTLAVWRITFFFYAEDGPWKIGVRLRRFAGNGFWGELLDCFYCLSVWVTLPFAAILGESWLEKLILWPALSAGASLLQKFSHHDVRPITPIYHEDPEPTERELGSRPVESGEPADIPPPHLPPNVESSSHGLLRKTKRTPSEPRDRSD